MLSPSPEEVGPVAVEDRVQTPKPVQEIGKRHLATIALLVLGYSAYYFCRSDFSVALPLILAELVRHGANPHVAEIRLGWIASIGVLAYSIGKVPAGVLADRFGGVKNFLGGMAGAVLFSLLFIAGGGFPIFTLAWIGNRLSQSLGWPGMVKVSSRWFSYSSYGTIMGVLSLSYLFGDAVSREAMSLLLARGVGWRGLFVAGAALLALLLVLNLLFLRESPEAFHLPPAQENPRNLFAGGERPEDTQPGTALIFKRLFGSRVFWAICLLSLGTTLLRETFNLWTPTYLTQAAGMSGAGAASGSAIFPFFGGLSVLAAGFLSDLLGPAGRGRILFGGLALSVLALAALAFSPSHAPVILPLSLVGAVAFLLIGPYSYLAGAISLDFGGKGAGATASGIVDGVGYLGAILSGNAMAWVAVTHGWRAFFLLLAILAMLSSLVAMSILREPSSRVARSH